MTFRDDHDAALARADALEDEVERTKRERDELAARVQQLEAENKQPPRPPEQKRARSASESSSASSDRFAKILGVLAVVGAIGGVALVSMCRSRTYAKEHAAWQAKFDARKSYETRWNHLAALEPCIHRIAWGSMSVRGSTPDKIDPRRTTAYAPPGGATHPCSNRAKELLADPEITQPFKAALGTWIDHQRVVAAAAKPVEEYYSHGDWREDDFAGATELWKPLLATLPRQSTLVEAVRRDVLPAARDAMRAMIKTHETSNGRDELYWRAALTVALYELTDRGFAAAGIYDGKHPPDLAAAGTALQQPVTQFKELVTQAPIEVRRDLRQLDWILDPFAAGEFSKAETPLWHLQNGEAGLLGGRNGVPGLPPDPGKPPENPSSD